MEEPKEQGCSPLKIFPTDQSVYNLIKNIISSDQFVLGYIDEHGLHKIILGDLDPLQFFTLKGILELQLADYAQEFVSFDDVE
jgi:hypothetical protein